MKIKVYGSHKVRVYNHDFSKLIRFRSRRCERTIALGYPQAGINATFHMITGFFLGKCCDCLLQQPNVLLLKAVFKNLINKIKIKLFKWLGEGL